MFFNTRYIFASEVKYNCLSQMFFLFFLFISCHFSKLVAFFSSHVSSKLVASTFLCLVDSVVVHKKLRTVMSTPLANVICRLLSHLHFLMSKLKRAQEHLQNVISKTLALFWESFALVTTMDARHLPALPSFYQYINQGEVKRNYQCINQWFMCKFTSENYMFIHLQEFYFLRKDSNLNFH